MSNEVIVQVDRNQRLFLKFELSDDKLKITPVKQNGDALSADALKQDVDSLEILKRLSISKKVQHADGITHEPVARFTDSDDLALDITVEKPSQLTLGFNDMLAVADLAIDQNEITATQAYLSPITPTELRLAVNHALKPLASDLSQYTAASYKPKTDLHTHFAGIMTADILIEAIRKKNRNHKPVLYPVKYLLEAGFSLDDLESYFPEGTEEKNFDAFKTHCLENLDIAKFDITQFIPPAGACEEAVERSGAHLAKLKKLFEIPATKTIIFNEMETYYNYRDVLIKDTELLPFFLRQIAKDYKKQGIEYAEISFSKVNDPKYLKIIDQEIPKIEEKEGVKIRFLGVLPRKFSVKTRKSLIKFFKTYATLSPYVVGMDLLAAETNSTYDVYSQLIDLCEWSRAFFPGMTIRVHAGETSYHPENVAAVVELAKRYPRVNFRVGHGIYGVSQQVLDDVKTYPRIHLIPEMNMASNVALNMQATLAKHSVFDYLKKNIHLVLGSDGHGLYQSVNTDLIKLLHYGKDIDLRRLLENLKHVENRHINYIGLMFQERTRLFLLALLQTADRKHMLDTIKEEIHSLDHKHILFNTALIDDIMDNSKLSSMQTKALVRLHAQLRQLPIYNELWKETFATFDKEMAEYTRDEERRKHARNTFRAQNENAVRKFCSENHIKHAVISKNTPQEHEKYAVIRKNTPQENESASYAHKTPIMLNGIISFVSHWQTKRAIHDALSFIQVLLSHLKPEEYYFVTSGTNIGVQQYVHDMIHQHNRTHPAKSFDLVGYVPANVKKTSLSDKLTHLVMLKDVPSIYDMFEFYNNRVRHPEHGLKLVTLGGGMWNRDLIQVVANALDETHGAGTDLASQQLLLMSQLDGASADKAKELPACYSHANYTTLLSRLIGPYVSEDEITEEYKQQVETITPYEEALKHIARTTSSSPREYATKAKRFIIDERVTIDDLETYFQFRLSRESVSHCNIYKLMQQDETIKAQIDSIANQFAMVPETTDSFLAMPSHLLTNSKPGIRRAKIQCDDSMLCKTNSLPCSTEDEPFSFGRTSSYDPRHFSCRRPMAARSEVCSVAGDCSSSAAVDAEFETRSLI